MPGARTAAAAAIIMIGGALAGYAGYRTWQAHRTPASELAWATANAPSQDPTRGPPPPRQGVPAQVPDITLPDLAGHPRSTREFLGHPLIINFWATWCEPCRREIPLLAQLLQDHRAEQLQIVGIAVDFRSAVSQYNASTPLAYPVLIGEDQGMIAAGSFGMEPVLPFSVFSDATGQIIAVKVGELHPDEADLILGEMRSAADGHESLPTARSRIADGLRQLAVARSKKAVTTPVSH